MTAEQELRQSKVVQAMRFPLVVLVLYVHALPFQSHHVSLSLSGENIFHFITEAFSHSIGGMAVCWFYVISGYFFFWKLNADTTGWRWVEEKWKKRFKTLFVPYVFWNLFTIAIIVLKNHLFLLLGLGEDELMPVVRHLDVANWLWSGPADFPLYYVRDLMLMSLVAPLWYNAVRQFKWGSLAILAMVYIFAFSPAIPDVRAIFFFGLGAWLGIWKVNMLSICRKVRLWALIGFIPLLFLSVFFNSSGYYALIMRIFYPFSMIVFMNVCDLIAENSWTLDKLSHLSGTVFFIYAVHEIYILGWTKGLFLRLFGDSVLGSWMGYIFVPLMVLMVCLALFRLLNYLMPRTLAFVCGGRVTATQ